MNLVQNRSISASAGTGKTFRLAHRYIGLMSAGVAPDRICALTFSRKAAADLRRNREVGRGTRSSPRA